MLQPLSELFLSQVTNKEYPVDPLWNEVRLELELRCSTSIRYILVLGIYICILD